MWTENELFSLNHYREQNNEFGLDSVMGWIGHCDQFSLVSVMSLDWSPSPVEFDCREWFGLVTEFRIMSPVQFGFRNGVGLVTKFSLVAENGLDWSL